MMEEFFARGPAGPPGGMRTMILVPGFGCGQDVWADVARAFNRDYRVVLCDNVGLGRFGQLRQGGIDLLAEDLSSLCDRQGLKDVIAVGHGFGGMISLLAAADRPDLFSRLVLIAASPRYLDDEGYRGGFSQQEIDVLYQGIGHSFTDWVESFAERMLPAPEQPALVRRLTAALKALPPQSAEALLRSILQADHRAALGRVRQPTLLIHGNDDPTVPLTVARYLHRAIAGSRLAVLETPGHLPHVSAPDQVVAAMRAFGL